MEDKINSYIFDLIDEILSSKYTLTFATTVVMSYYAVGSKLMKEGEEVFRG